jgi:hypothetical protein
MNDENTIINNLEHKKNPPLYTVVDKLYHGVMDNKFVPSYFKKHPELSASILANTGTVAVLGAVQKGTEIILPQFYAHNFKTLEALCIVGMVCVAVAYKNKLVDFVTEHPVYSSGMVSTWLTSIGMALYDLNK